MAKISNIRLNVVLRELNISLDRAVEFLAQQNIEIEGRPTSKISMEIYQILLDEFETDKSKKDASHEIGEEKMRIFLKMPICNKN